MLAFSGCCSFSHKPKLAHPDKVASIRFNKDGHQFTTALIAIFAGLPDTNVYALTYYSQVPDLECRFNATFVCIWDTFIPWRWGWRSDITQALHSLHGGNNAEVQFRRLYLGELIRQKVRLGTPQSLMEAGLMIHSMGDSYSHTSGKYKSGNEEAFGPLYGHLFKGHSPDEIAQPEVFPRYADYVNHLFNVLGGKDAGRPQLDDYTNRLAKLVWNPTNECFSTANKRMVDAIKSISTNTPGWSWDGYNAFLQKTEPLTRAQVQKVMDEINHGP
jgi:hypothetical protein